jgi:hypothetical protein
VSQEKEKWAMSIDKLSLAAGTQKFKIDAGVLTYHSALGKIFAVALEDVDDITFKCVNDEKSALRSVVGESILSVRGDADVFQNHPTLPSHGYPAESSVISI